MTEKNKNTEGDSKLYKIIMDKVPKQVLWGMILLLIGAGGGTTLANVIGGLSPEIGNLLKEETRVIKDGNEELVNALAEATKEGALSRQLMQELLAKHTSEITILNNRFDSTNASHAKGFQAIEEDIGQLGDNVDDLAEKLNLVIKLSDR